jgi:hypothetical protein
MLLAKENLKRRNKSQGNPLFSTNDSDVYGCEWTCMRLLNKAIKT